jgi:hypothetical protein
MTAVLPKTKQRAIQNPAESTPAVKRFLAAEPDLHTQLETLLHEVWECEAEWRFDDRIDLALNLHRS